jgi:hypothetical protein
MCGTVRGAAVVAAAARFGAGVRTGAVTRNQAA